MRLDVEGQAIVEQNIGLAINRAIHWATSTGWTKEECISIAYEGLCRAVSTFKKEKGYTLSTYVYVVIDNLFLSEIRKLTTGKRSGIVTSLDEPRENDVLLIELIGKKDDDTLENSEYLRFLLSKCSKLQNYIIQRLYFDGRTQSEVAKETGLSQTHVSRLLLKAISRMKGVAMSG